MPFKLTKKFLSFYFLKILQNDWTFKILALNICKNGALFAKSRQISDQKMTKQLVVKFFCKFDYEKLILNFD